MKVLRHFGNGLLLAAALQAAQAASVTLGLIVLADDDRLTPQRTEQPYPGHPGGTAQQGVEVALKESAFELDAAGLQVKLQALEVRSAEEAGAAARQLEKAGAAALLADLPTPALLAASAQTKLAVLNLGNGDDTLREQQCRGNLLHTWPSERMRADALSQYLVSRRWARVLLLHGPRPADAQRLAVVSASLKRHGLKVTDTRAFKLSADPRERQFANVALLTGGTDHDVVWVVDSDGEFARGLPYRTALPRPVMGDAGLVALAWAPQFERYGGPQLSRRFLRHAQRPMTGHDWAAWMAAKAVVQALVAQRSGKPPAPQALVANGFALDGFKGMRLGFRPWDRQLRQPLLLGDGQAVIATAPVDGVLHPSHVLDTLGADAPEKRCAASLP